MCLNEFVKEWRAYALNSGELSLPTLAVIFLFCAEYLHEKVQETRKNCRKYVAKLFSAFGLQTTQNMVVCHSLRNISLMQMFCTSCT